MSMTDFEGFPIDPNECLEVEAEGTFTWSLGSLENLSNRETSEPFLVGGHNWNILIFPRGNTPVHNESLSLYVAHDFTNSDKSVCADMVIRMYIYRPDTPDINQNDIDESSYKVVKKYLRHRFETFLSDMGWSNFVGLDAISGSKIKISATLRVIKDKTGVLWHSFTNYNSKSVTGYVGLSNQGATCYMNSLLQSMFHMPLFKKAIYALPTAEEQAQLSNLAKQHDSSNLELTQGSPKRSPSSEVSSYSGHMSEMTNALALQRIFWRLENNDQPVGTEELTRAFGWDSHETFIQSDVHEFNTVLMDNLEERMKGTPVEGQIQSMFVGKICSIIRCVDVPFESKNTQSFYDLQVTVKGLKSLEDSLNDYISKERLDGDNKYYAGEKFGLQAAEKFVMFESLPPILHIHLARYDFDYQTMVSRKINDRFEFPRYLSMAPYVIDNSPNDYVLRAVFVHAGDTHGGHYYVYIRDLSKINPQSLTKNSQNDSVISKDQEDEIWLKFDDTKVIPSTGKEAVEDNFGISAQRRPIKMTTEERVKRFTNAYMLCYVRVSDIDKVYAPALNVPPHIGPALLHEEMVERNRRSILRNQMMSFSVKIITTQMLLNPSYNVSFDLANFENANLPSTQYFTITARIDWTIGQLRIAISEMLKSHLVDSEKLNQTLDDGKLIEIKRIWNIRTRRNKTSRVCEGLFDDSIVVGEIGRGRSVASPTLLVELQDDSVDPDIKLQNPFPITVKTIDFVNNKIRILSPAILFIGPRMRIDDLCAILRNILKVEINTPIEIYEEIKPGKITPILSKANRPNPLTFMDELQIQIGDILVVSVGSQDVVGFYENMQMTRIISISPHREENNRESCENKLPILGLHNNEQINPYRPHETDDTSSLETIDLTVNIRKMLYMELLEIVSSRTKVPVSHLRLYLSNEKYIENSPNSLLSPQTEMASPLKGTAGQSVEDVINSLEVLNSHKMIHIFYEKSSIPTIELDSMTRIWLQNLFSFNTRLKSTYIGPNDTLQSLYNRDTKIFELEKAAPSQSECSPNEIVLYEVLAGHIIRIYQSKDSLSPLCRTDQNPNIQLLFTFECGEQQFPLNMRESNEASKVCDGTSKFDSDHGSKTQLFGRCAFASIFNYHRDVSRTHGRPTRLPIIPGETFALTKKRLLTYYLPLSTEEVRTITETPKQNNDVDGNTPVSYDTRDWTFSVISYGRIIDISDESVLSDMNFSFETSEIGINRPIYNEHHLFPTPPPLYERSIKIK